MKKRSPPQSPPSSPKGGSPEGRGEAVTALWQVKDMKTTKKSGKS